MADRLKFWDCGCPGGSGQIKFTLGGALILGFSIAAVAILSCALLYYKRKASRMSARVKSLIKRHMTKRSRTTDVQVIPRLVPSPPLCRHPCSREDPLCHPQNFTACDAHSDPPALEQTPPSCHEEEAVLMQWCEGSTSRTSWASQLDACGPVQWRGKEGLFGARPT